MEKIYDENQQQQRQQQKKKIKIDGVSMLAFAVAIFAVISLVAAGISSFSYALPADVVELPESFAGVQNNDVIIKDPLTAQEVSYHYYLNGTEEVNLLCLQRDIPFSSGNFTKTNGSTVSSDVGLLYLLANLAPNATLTYPSTGFNIPNSAANKKFVDHWVSQMAVWYYLNGKNEENNETSTTFENVKNVSWVYIGNGDTEDQIINGGDECIDDSYCFGYVNNSAKIFDTVTTTGGVTISQLITNAKAKSGMAYSISLSDGDGTISTDSNKEYYFSPLYTVVSSIDSSVGELTSYSLTVTAKNQEGNTVNVDAVITDKDGNVKNDVSALTPSQLSTFYVRIPANKVTENVTINVGINGTFRMYEGLKYKLASNDNSQEVTTVKFVNKTTSSGKSYDLAPAPDTGISAGQTIYFVGLIVLLCGVGIIYANAKPAKAQN